jgi:hypothetical protein
LVLERAFPADTVAATVRFYEPSVFQILPADLNLAQPAFLNLQNGGHKLSRAELFRSDLAGTSWQRAGRFVPPNSGENPHYEHRAAVTGPGLWTWLFAAFAPTGSYVMKEAECEFGDYTGPARQGLRFEGDRYVWATGAARTPDATRTGTFALEVEPDRGTLTLRDGDRPEQFEVVLLGDLMRLVSVDKDREGCAGGGASFRDFEKRACIRDDDCGPWICTADRACGPIDVSDLRPDGGLLPDGGNAADLVQDGGARD